MSAAARIVVRYPCVHISRETDIKVWRRICILQNVHEPLAAGHGDAEGKADARTIRIEISGSIVAACEGSQFLRRLQTRLDSLSDAPSRDRTGVTEPKLVRRQNGPAFASLCDATARHPSPAFM